jgi:hypothetical protein
VETTFFTYPEQATPNPLKFYHEIFSNSITSGSMSHGSSFVILTTSSVTSSTEVLNSLKGN